MTRSAVRSWILVVVAAQVTACGSADDVADLHEVGRGRAGALEVVLLSANQSVRPGKDSYLVEFRSADGRPVDVGEVMATASMPMPGMAPMIGGIDITPTSTAGRYAVASDLSMIGDWRLALEWSGPAGAGSGKLSVAVQP